MSYIAIAEDNLFLVKSLKKKLSFFSDLQVKNVSKNGIELLDFLEKDSDIDIVLMDIRMPGMNGIEATRLVKEKFPYIKVIMLTVFDDEKTIFDAIMAGANGYLLKEIDPKALYESIKNVLDGGAPMTPEIAVKTLDLLRNPLEKSTNSNEDFLLSKRQIEILELISKGKSYKEIAGALFIALGTVRKHVENIYKLLQVHSKIEAIQKAKEQGYIL